MDRRNSQVEQTPCTRAPWFRGARLRRIGGRGPTLTTEAVFVAALLLAGLSACDGGAEIDLEGQNALIGSPFPTTLLIPTRYGGGLAYVQTASPPLLGTFVFHLDSIPPPPQSDFYDLSRELQGVPDSLVMEEDRDLAFVTTSGKEEGVFVFNPANAFSYAASYTYNDTWIDFPHELLDSAGHPLDGTRPVLTSGIARVDGKTYISTSNFIQTGSTPVCAPGTVLVVPFEADAAPPYFAPDSEQKVIFTTRYNPTEVTPFEFTGSAGGASEEHRVVLVTNTGVLAIQNGNGVPVTQASVDVLDTDHDCVVASYPLDLAAPAFSKIAIARQEVVVSEDGDEVHYPVYRGFLGSAAYSHVYELDLTGLEDYLLQGSPGSVPCPEITGERILFGKVLASWWSPILATGKPRATPDLTHQVVVNFDSTQAYATGFNSGTLAVLEIGTEAVFDATRQRYLPRSSRKRPLNVMQLTDPLPSLNVSGPGPVAVRPGIPGIDYQGPDVFVVVGSPIGELRSVRTY